MKINERFSGVQSLVELLIVSKLLVDSEEVK